MVCVLLGVEHQEQGRWGRQLKKWATSSESHVHVLHQLHVLGRHRDVLHLVKPSQTDHILLVDFLVDLLRILLHLLGVEETLTDGACSRLAGGCSPMISFTRPPFARFSLVALGSDERQCVGGILNG